jgi:hypothetical protein
VIVMIQPEVTVGAMNAVNYRWFIVAFYWLICQAKPADICYLAKVFMLMGKHKVLCNFAIPFGMGLLCAQPATG